MSSGSGDERDRGVGQHHDDVDEGHSDEQLEPDRELDENLREELEKEAGIVLEAGDRYG